MDLRKKASAIQLLGEWILRLRLIFVLAFAVLYVIFARDFSAIFAYAHSAGDSLLAYFGLTFAGMPDFLREWGAFLAAGLVFLFLLAFLFVPIAFFKALLPALLVAFFWTAISAQIQLPPAEYAAFLLVDALGILLAAIFAGSLLKKGTPVSGARMGAFCRMFFPVLALHLIIGGVCGYFFRHEPLSVWILFPLISLLLFLFAEFPMFTFAPMGKMRAAQRTMDL
ncbi:MAG: hypothetical protein ACI38O_07690 [Fibrobacter intestinalis]|uniref:hypothetical protein n=1 Tax=Fibrobacter intestinalis TaxID=28122 RepID=UPI003EFC6FA1